MVDCSCLSPSGVSADEMRCRLQRFMSQSLIQGRYHYVHMLFLDDVRWKESEHSFVGTINDDSLLEKASDNVLGKISRVQLQREHQAQTAHLGNRLMLFGKGTELRSEVSAHLLHVGLQMNHLLEKFDCDGTR